MTRTIRTIAAAALLVTPLVANPAMAGGSVSIGFHPSSQQEANALQTGLRLYGLYKGIKSGSIKQRGYGNVAGIAQNGSGNLGVVHQKGNGHEGTIRQSGNDNAYGLFQFGRNTSAHAVQTGHNQAGATFQYGW